MIEGRASQEEGPPVAKAHAQDDGERARGPASQKGMCSRESGRETAGERCTRQGQDILQSLTGHDKHSGFCPQRALEQRSDTFELWYLKGPLWLL